MIIKRNGKIVNLMGFDNLSASVDEVEIVLHTNDKIIINLVGKGFKIKQLGYVNDLLAFEENIDKLIVYSQPPSLIK